MERTTIMTGISKVNWSDFISPRQDEQMPYEQMPERTTVRDKLVFNISGGTVNLNIENRGDNIFTDDTTEEETTDA